MKVDMGVELYRDVGRNEREQGNLKRRCEALRTTRSKYRM